MPLAETFSRLSQVETRNELDQNLLRQLPSQWKLTKNDFKPRKLSGNIELKQGENKCRAHQCQMSANIAGWSSGLNLTNSRSEAGGGRREVGDSQQSLHAVACLMSLAGRRPDPHILNRTTSSLFWVGHKSNGK